MELGQVELTSPVCKLAVLNHNISSKDRKKGCHFQHIFRLVLECLLITNMQSTPKTNQFLPFWQLTHCDLVTWYTVTQCHYLISCWFIVKIISNTSQCILRADSFINLKHALTNKIDNKCDGVRQQWDSSQLVSTVPGDWHLVSNINKQQYHILVTCFSIMMTKLVGVMVDSATISHRYRRRGFFFSTIS